MMKNNTSKDIVTTTHPAVQALLPRRTLEALSSDSSDPFKDEDEYLSSMEALFSLRKNLLDMQRTLQEVVVAVANADSKPALPDYQSHKESIAKIEAHLGLLVKQRLNVMRERKELLPRIVRYAEKIPLNDKETELIIFILVVHIGELGRPKYLEQDNYHVGLWGTSPITAGLICGMRLREVAEFLAPNRLHMKQGLLDTQYRDPLSPPNFLRGFGFNNEALKFFMGAKLTSDEQLKIDKTLVAEISAQENPDKIQTPVANESIPQTATQDKSKVDVDIVDILKEEREKERQKREESAALAKAALDRAKGDLDKDKEEEIALDAGGDDEDDNSMKPYKTDLEYLDDNFKLLAAKNVEANSRAFYGEASTRTEAARRQQEGKVRVLTGKVQRRMKITRENGTWIPRLERLAVARNLDQNEKFIILVLIGYVIVPEPEFQNYHDPNRPFVNPSVNELIRALCPTLENQIKFRVYFYKNSTLVREGIIKLVNSGLQGDLIHSRVEIDRRMLDFTVGLDTEFSEVVEGSHLYHPTVQLEHVVLPEDQKQLILNSVSHFASYKKWRKTMGFDEVISYGNGMVLLFYGSSGTGKTMMANSVANHLQKKVLLINFPSLGSMSAGENFKFIFREAKINDAILFFDECESIFESRDKGQYDVTMLLTELERHDGLIILATNRPHDLDEAMHRRITLAIEFKKPDHLLRQEIWKALLPKKIKLADDIDWKLLALKFELTGGFIKNAILSALSLAVSRNGEAPEICQADLIGGAKLQLRGRLQMKSFERRVVPTLGVDDCILDPEVSQNLYEIVNSEKARSVLFGQWGFGKHIKYEQGTTALFYGPPGTGKSLAAEAIGYEIGQPLKVVNCAELISKWVGETGKNIEAIFEEAKTLDAILLFDEAEGLFGQRSSASGTSTDRYANVDTGLLLYHMERFSGVVVLTTNMLTSIDNAFFRRLKYVIEFPIPKPNLRAKLWKVHIPKEAPVAADIDYDVLAKKFEFAGGNIKNAVFKAACRAALRPSSSRISMDDLTAAATEEIKKMKGEFSSGTIYT